MSSKRATHTIKVMVKDGHPRAGEKGVVGAAWINADGSFSIRLDPGAVLRWDDPVMVTAFPRTKRDGDGDEIISPRGEKQ